MSNNLILNVAMVESFPEVELLCSSTIVQGGFLPHFSPNGINFSPISKDPHKASSVFISSIKEKLLCDREFQDDVVQQPSVAKSEVSDTVEEIKGRVVMNEMSR